MRCSKIKKLYGNTPGELCLESVCETLKAAHSKHYTEVSLFGFQDLRCNATRKFLDSTEVWSHALHLKTLLAFKDSGVFNQITFYYQRIAIDPHARNSCLNLVVTQKHKHTHKQAKSTGGCANRIGWTAQGRTETQGKACLASGLPDSE